MGTIAQGVADLKLRLFALRAIPMAATQAAMTIIEARVPVYTGTYQDAIKWDNEDPLDCRVYVSVSSLLASAMEHSEEIAEMAIPQGQSPSYYISGDVNPMHPGRGYRIDEYGEPYPIRIEATGSPIFYEGEGMWAEASAAAGATIETLLAAVRL